MKSSILLASLLLIINQAAAATRFHQDRFGIGFWVDPPADQQTDARFAEIAAANFSFIIGNFGATTPAAVSNQLKLCEKHGLKAIVSMAGLPPEKLADGPACWGYHIADEPGAGAFSSLQQTVDALRKARPGKLGYINLFPDYAPVSALGTTSYVAHVAKFCAEVQPDVLSMDHYPMFNPQGDGRDAYCRNLEVMRDQSVKAGIPFWNFFNTMPYGPHTDPTEAQLRWQVFASATYGAKGVMYFCYWTPAGDEFPKGGAIIRRDGKRTRHYAEARRINAVLRNLGPTLMECKSTGVIRIKPGEDPAAAVKGTAVRSITAGNFIIGSFQHADGRRALMLMNYEHAFSAWPTVEFDADQVLEVDPATGKERAVEDDSPAMAGLQVSLDAGQARLFLLPQPK